MEKYLKKEKKIVFYYKRSLYRLLYFRLIIMINMI